MLFGGEECDELESEAGGSHALVGRDEGAGSKCRLATPSSPLVGFSQSSRTGLLPALQWEEAPEGFGQPLHCRVAGGGLGAIAHSISCTSATMAMNRYPF